AWKLHRRRRVRSAGQRAVRREFLDDAHAQNRANSVGDSDALRSLGTDRGGKDEHGDRREGVAHGCPRRRVARQLTATSPGAKSGLRKMWRSKSTGGARPSTPTAVEVRKRGSRIQRGSARSSTTAKSPSTTRASRSK